jgi:hypothetical protein
MKLNPLIKEIRDYRDQLAKDCDYDMHKLYDFHKKRENRCRNPIATIKPIQPILEVAESQADYNKQ